MSQRYATFILPAPDGRRIARVWLRLHEGPPPRGWLEVADPRLASAVTSSPGLFYLDTSGRVLKKTRVSVRPHQRKAPGDGQSTIRISFDGRPPDRALRVRLNDRTIVVPADEDLELMWQGAAQVAIEVDPAEYDIVSDPAIVEFTG